MATRVKNSILNGLTSKPAITPTYNEALNALIASSGKKKKPDLRELNDPSFKWKQVLDEFQSQNSDNNRTKEPLTLMDLNEGTTNNYNPLNPQEGGLASTGNNDSLNGIIQALLGDSSYLSQFLGNLGASGAANSDFLQLLLLIASGNLNKSGTIDDDLQQKLIDMFLQNMQNQEQRQYDQSVVNDERNYQSPTNQLARLMGAGISRDAALQILQGAGSSESPLVGSQSSSGITDTPTYGNQLNQGFQTAFGFIGSISSLVGLGFSIPQAIHQAHFLKNQNLLSDKQISSYNSSGRAFQILNAAGASADAFGSVSSAAAALSKLATEGNTDAANFIATGGLDQMRYDAPFSSRTLADLYQSERSSSDYATRFGLEVDRSEAEIDFTKADKERVVQGIVNLQAELDATVASTEFTRLQSSLVAYSKKVMSAQAELLKKQGKVAEAESLLKQAQSLAVQSQTKTIDLANQLTEGTYNEEVDGQTGLQIMTHGAAVNAYNDMKKFVAAKNKHIWDKEINAMAADYTRMYRLCLLQATYSKGALDKYMTDDNFKDLMNTCAAFQESGAWNYMQLKLQGIKNAYPSQNGLDPFYRIVGTSNLFDEFGIE